MALKTYKPITAGQRTLVLVDKADIWRGSPEKSLTKGKSKTGGRNNNGRITSRSIGGGHKRKYRLIDFKRSKRGITAEVLRIEYDPNRSCFIALLQYEDGEKTYILAPQKLTVGQKVEAGEKADILVGNALPLRNIPIGTLVHNIEMKPGKGGQLVKSAGASAQFVGKDLSKAQIKLPSGELRMVSLDCYATVGVLSNPDHKNTNLGKAGRKRWLGRRPHVRGVAMNPIDHPHGGGEGKTSGGRHPVTPWGKPTKGKKTRSNKRTDKLIITRRK